MLLFPIAESVVVQTVKSGETAILPCPSDDKIHRFQYWLLKNDMTIGPWNSSNTFRYEVWSGQLIIKNVTEEDSGLYQCFSKKLMGRELKSETVSLLVQIELEKSTAKDTQVNANRIVICFLVLLMVVIFGAFCFYIRRRTSAGEVCHFISQSTVLECLILVVCCRIRRDPLQGFAANHLSQKSPFNQIGGFGNGFFQKFVVRKVLELLRV
ncbi:hypothetical protein RUM44_007702 [Polyplax serrata]|uniref:Ig-like domain-containing protein n=1 Tax=Polyplax serrata TaxID=468196 RepID=A0ABR1BB54_POLSC